MEGKEAGEYIKEMRDYRAEIASPLKDVTTPPDTRSSILEDLKTLHELNREDPDYRQAMRVIAELRGQREINKKTPEFQQNVEFPTDPEERFRQIISSVGNHAGKQITFLSIPSIPNVIITPQELHTAFVENSGYVWKTARTLQKLHARKSLVPIGMVAEEAVIRSGNDEQTVGFTQTEAGREYADPICKFLLMYAAQHSISLEKTLGTTSSPTTSRAPYNRARILEYLCARKDEPNTRIEDIAEELGISDNAVTFSLQELQNESGFVIYESVDPENSVGKFVYLLNPDYKEVESKFTYNALIVPVKAAILTLKERGIDVYEMDTVLAEIQKTNPAFKRGALIHVLSDLSINRYLKRGEFHRGAIQSNVQIVNEGIDFVNEVLYPLHTAHTDTSEGQQLRNKWRNIPWREFAPQALTLHRKNSNMANHTDPQETQAIIIEAVKENPGIYSSEIAKIIKKKGSPFKSLSGTHLMPMFGSGLLERKKDGRATRWYLPEKPENEETDSIDEKDI